MRINLFRELQEKQGKRISHSRILMIALTVAIFVFGVGIGVYHHNQKVKALTASIEAAQKELQKIIAIKEELAKPSKEQKEFQEISALDETWTSLMWKISTFTGPKIIFRKIRLARPVVQSTPATPQGSPQATTVVQRRQILIEGDAKSIPALKDWLANVIVNIPNYNFVMDQQATSVSGPFPIQFKVTANLNTSGA